MLCPQFILQILLLLALVLKEKYINYIIRGSQKTSDESGNNEKLKKN
jgi:hypothetical protein